MGRVTSTTAAGGTDASAHSAEPTDLVRFLPLAAGLATLVVALLTIGHRPLWLDEAFTIGATNQLGESFVQRSGSMFLYYVIVAPLVDVSVDAAWLRLPSALLSAGAVAMTVHLARVYFSRTIAIWTAILLVPMWAVTRYAQEVRAYSLVMLLASVTWWLLFRVAERERRMEWVLLGVVWVGLVYSHPFAGLLVVAQLGAMRMASAPADGPSLLRRSTPAWVTAGLLLLPMLAAMALQDEGVAPDWVPPLGRWTVSNVLEMVAGPWGVGQLVAVAALGVASIAIARRTVSEVDSWRHRSLLLWLWSPVAVLVLVSIGSPLLAGRFVIGSVPAAAMVLAVAIEPLAPRWRAIGGVCFVLALLPGQVMLHRDEGHPWDRAVQVIDADPSLTTSRHGVVFLDHSSRNGFEVNAVGSLVFSRSEPLIPREPWGTFLRYYEEVELPTFEASLVDLDVLWLVEQFQSGVTEPPWHWQAEEPFESLGFCRDVTHTFERSIEVVRFVRCG